MTISPRSLSLGQTRMKASWRYGVTHTDATPMLLSAFEADIGHIAAEVEAAMAGLR